MAGDLWTVEPLPAEAVSAVRAATGALVAQVVDAIALESAEYGEVLKGPEGMAIRLGIEQAIRAFLDAIEQGGRPGPVTAEIWRRLGEVEFQSGRGLDALRAAFRTGTRALWRGAAELAAEAGIPTHQVISLAEAIFVFADELASDVVEGYLRAQSDEAGELERRRRRLATVLLDPAGSDPDALSRGAALARWTVPRSLAVIAVAGASPSAITRGLGDDALVGADADGVFVVVPDPDGPGRRAELERAMADESAVLGPTVPTREAHRSLRWSRLALDLLERGALAPRRPVRAEDELASIILLHDEELARALIAARLAPLEALRESERDRLIETLESWLTHQRHVPAIAEALHVHPQTVRYRVAKLRELLGDVLEDPDARFELELAVRARRALAT